MTPRRPGVSEAPGPKRRGAVPQDTACSDEKRARQIVESVQTGIWMFGPDSVSVFANQRMADMMGVLESDLVGVRLVDFLGPESSGAGAALASSRIGDETSLRFIRPDGSDFWGFTATTAVFDEKGVCEGSLVQVTDATEQRKLQAQVIALDRMASMGFLAAGVAHEINNPLASVIANLDMAIEGVGEAKLSGQYETIVAAREAAERVKGIVSDLRVFSRSEKEVGPVDVVKLLDSTIRLAWNEIRHRAKLVRDYNEVPDVISSKARLGQVFLNLLVNAAQAIHVGRIEENEISVRVSLGGSRSVVIEISDTGSGIPEEILPRIFSPFFTTKSEEDGTGLGLAICHRIVKSLGGELTVTSKVGRGSTFVVRLPSTREVEVIAPRMKAISSRRVRVKKAKVLVIDDDLMLLSAMKRILVPEYDAVFLSRAADGLDLVRKPGVKFDLILCDLMMPELSGMDFYEEVGKHDPRLVSRIVFLTGGVFAERAKEFMDRVKSPKIEKPFGVADFRAAIEDHIEKIEKESAG